MSQPAIGTSIFVRASGETFWFYFLVTYFRMFHTTGGYPIGFCLVICRLISFFSTCHSFLLGNPTHPILLSLRIEGKGFIDNFHASSFQIFWVEISKRNDYIWEWIFNGTNPEYEINMVRRPRTFHPKNLLLLLFPFLSHFLLHYYWYTKPSLFLRR